MLKKQGYLNIDLIILIALLAMVSYWLVATPKVDVLKTVQNLPQLTVKKIISPAVSQEDNQASAVDKKPVVDSRAAAKLSTQSVRNTGDLENIGRDVDAVDVESLGKSISQIDTDIQ